MTPFDFRQVKNGSPLPLVEKDFIFGLNGAATASVRPIDGISCGSAAILQLTMPANAVDLNVVNSGAAPASISAWSLGPGGLQPGRTEVVPARPGIQLIRFDFAGILRIVFESSDGGLYLQTIR